MGKTNKVQESDTILKEFFRDERRFADLFNAALFEGKTVIRPEDLEEKDTDISSTVEDDKYLESIVRLRDVVKKNGYGVDFVVVGLENQMNVHYAMPLRTMIYDDLTYLKESNQIIAKNKKEKAYENSAEFLSGFRKEDRLHGVITLVVYYGSEPWDGPLTLSDMVETDHIPEEICKCFADYRMNLFQVRDSGEVEFSNKELNVVFHISAMLLRKEFEQLKETVGQETLNQELKRTIGAITGSIDKLRPYLDEKGEEDMRTWVDDLQDMGREEGREQGIAAVILDNLEEQKTKEQILAKLEKLFSLASEEAERYYEKYSQ